MGVEEGTSKGEGAECGEEVKCFKAKPVNNGFGSLFVNDSGDGSSGASDSFRTYKRRRQLRSSSKVKVQDGGRASTDQVALPGTDHCASLTDSNYCAQRKWRNVVLEHMHQLLSGDEGGMQRCIQNALLHHRDNGYNVTDSDTSHEDKQKCSLQAGQIPNGTQHTSLEGVICNGSFRESNPRTTTEMCQRVFFDVIISEKFTTLCKLLFDNFQGVKLDSLFHLSLINSRMNDGVYERSPVLFSSDIQQVWRKLQEIGTEMTSLSKSLSNISSTYFSEQVGCSGGAVEEEKHEFCTRESETLAKPEQTEACGVYKVSTCRHCGEKADGKDCLVCDSCEEMYHVTCIKHRYRPIAPKPDVPTNSMNESSGMSQKMRQSPYLRNLWPQLQARPTRTRKRGRAALSAATVKRTRTHVLGLSSPSPVTFPAKNLSLQGFSHGIPQRSVPNFVTPGGDFENSSTPPASLVTLPLLPCPPSVPVVADKARVPALSCMEPCGAEKVIDLNTVADIPEEKDLLKQLQGLPTSSVIAPQPVRPVGSSISVGCIKEDPSLTPPMQVPKKPEEVEEEVESEALPAVISDSNNKVRLANSAYKEMVGQPECPWLESMVVTGEGRSVGNRICGEVILHLSDSRMPVKSNGFSCWARIEWGSGLKKSSIKAFCDVIRLSCQSKDYLFTWRFHTHKKEPSQSSSNL